MAAIPWNIQSSHGSSYGKAEDQRHMFDNLALLLIVGCALAGGALGGVMFWRSRKNKEVPHHYLNCKNCKQRIKYKATQAGHKGACPRCKNHFTFPFSPEPAAQARRW